MKTPRTFRILRLMTNVIFSILHDEPVLLKGNLAQLDKLGGIYIKFLQIVVINLHSVNQENFLELLAVYERSSPDNIDIRAYLQEHHSTLYNRLHSINPKPIGTGSFGQVYEASLDGTCSVVIKVLRPSVMRYISHDLRLLSALSWLYSMFDRQKMLNFRDIYSEFRKTCEQEIDYVREAEVADHFYQRYREHKQMVIPKTFLELCTSRIIVQEQVKGVSLTDLFGLQTQGVDAREYVQTYLNSDLYEQLYTVGYELLATGLTGQLIHADPHPGNIVLLANNRVALIDFGMTTQLHHNRLAFLDLVRQYRNFYNGANPAIEELLVAALEFVSPKLYAAICSADSLLVSNDGVSLLDKLRQGTILVTQDKNSRALIDGLLRENRIMKTLFFAVNKGNRFGLTIDLEAIMLLKATHAYLSLVGPFDPPSVTLARVLSDVLVFADNNMDRVADDRPLELQPSEALEILSNWFDKMGRNDPLLMQHITGGHIS